jgi:hypothetical protein
MEEPFHVAKDRLITQFEKEYVGRLVNRAGGNINRAARRMPDEVAILVRAYRPPRGWVASINLPIKFDSCKVKGELRIARESAQFAIYSIFTEWQGLREAREPPFCQRGESRTSLKHSTI